MFEYLYFQDQRRKLLAALLLVLVVACTASPAIAVKPEQRPISGPRSKLVPHSLSCDMPWRPASETRQTSTSPIVAPSETCRATDADRPSKSATGLESGIVNAGYIPARGVAAATRQNF